MRRRPQAFPDRIEQIRLLRRGEAVDLASQIAHMPTTLARFYRSCKHEPRRKTPPGLETILLHVPPALQDGDYVQRLRVRPVEDEIRIDWQELHRFVREILAPVTNALTFC